MFGGLLIAAVGVVVSAVGVYVAWRKYKPPRRLSIGSPTPPETSLERVPVHGFDAPSGRHVYVINALPTKCYLQPGHAEPDPHGDWVHPATQLTSFGPRYVYALAVRADDAENLEKLFEGTVATVSDLKAELRSKGIKFELSKCWSLVRTEVPVTEPAD